MPEEARLTSAAADPPPLHSGRRLRSGPLGAQAIFNCSGREV